MSNTEPIIGLFVDAVTGESETRELTSEEIAELTKEINETPSLDDIVIVETPEEEP
jgi:hypothetical protein